MSALLTPVRNQGNVGSCVGHGLGINGNSIMKEQNFFVEWFSPTWIYNGARYKDGNLSQDVGTMPRTALEWIVEMGLLLEHFWPYDSSKLDMEAPSSTRQAQVIKYKDFAYYRVVDSAEGICNALASNHFVSIGGPRFTTWMTPQNGILPEVNSSSQMVGGHETCLYGYDLSKNIFYGVNSWGTSWGNQGLFIMPFSAIDIFKKFGGYDAHYMTFEGEPAPPGPTPSPCKVGNAITSAQNSIQKLLGRKGRFFYLNP
jgi:hypothetical protein